MKLIILIRPTLLLLSIGLLNARESSAQRKNFPYWALAPFVRPEHVNPVLSPDTAKFFDPVSGKLMDWESNDVFNPGAVVKDGKIMVLYRAEDKSGTGIGGRTSRIGLAESDDGIRMVRRSAPVLYPANDDQKVNEWPGGCEDPRVAVTEEGLYQVFYTQWNRKLPRLATATSRDLVNWTKHGPAFAKAYDGRFSRIASKSASIVTSLVKGKLVITRLHGLYWMYWGEENVYAATSTDLMNWKPLVEKDGSLKKLISPRKYHFDSQLTECGPPAVMMTNGILLLYNGKNLPGQGRDTNFTADTYCAGQVLFDKNDPTRALQRLDWPFLKPEAAFEKSGQYPAGTVFIEGLVYHRKKWLLYYGCADSRVAVAIYDPGAAGSSK